MQRWVWTIGLIVCLSGLWCAAEQPSRELAFPVADTPRPLTPLMERELRGCFDFFWKEWITDPASPTYGLTDGD